MERRPIRRPNSLTLLQLGAAPTSARIEQTLRPAGLDWITALRAPAIKQLAAAGGPLQPSLFTPAPAKAGAATSPRYQSRLSG
jgi:hypothetical protein